MNHDKIQQTLAVLKENTVDILPWDVIAKKVEDKIKANQPLCLKIGFDPTARDIHLGHTVLLRKLRKLQNIGHKVCLIIGDFTAKIGDPSGRNALRPVLSDQAIAENAVTYTSQAFKILDSAKTEIIYNSCWFKDMKLTDFLSLLSTYTVARILERDDFSLRLKENKPLSILEIIYPLVQGYDSVKIQADIEFGGTDQKFNLLVGRSLQEAFNQVGQGIITMPLLAGLDGTNKMSKSLGNYIGVTEEPKNMFGKLMSVPDETMWEYFRLLTEIDINTAKKMHPKEAKMLLAQTITDFYHGFGVGLKEKEEFQRVFSQKELPLNIPIVFCKDIQVDLMEMIVKAGLVSSKNEIRRLFVQNAVSIAKTGVILANPKIEIPLDGIVIKIGKRKYLKIMRG